MVRCRIKTDLFGANGLAQTGFKLEFFFYSFVFIEK
jgi:hypothetical protein